MWHCIGRCVTYCLHKCCCPPWVWSLGDRRRWSFPPRPHMSVHRCGSSLHTRLYLQTSPGIVRMWSRVIWIIDMNLYHLDHSDVISFHLDHPIMTSHHTILHMSSSFGSYISYLSYNATGLCHVTRLCVTIDMCSIIWIISIIWPCDIWILLTGFKCTRLSLTYAAPRLQM